jgi:hypothetical protein
MKRSLVFENRSGFEEIATSLEYLQVSFYERLQKAIVLAEGNGNRRVVAQDGGQISLRRKEYLRGLLDMIEEEEKMLTAFIKTLIG